MTSELFKRLKTTNLMNLLIISTKMGGIDNNRVFKNRMTLNNLILTSYSDSWIIIDSDIFKRLKTTNLIEITIFYLIYNILIDNRILIG